MIKTAEEILKENSNTAFMWNMVDVIEAMEVYAAQFKPKWIPVTERLPENRTYVMVCNYNGYDIAEYKHGCFFIGLDKVDCVTHWMPLPTPPETIKP